MSLRISLFIVCSAILAASNARADFGPDTLITGDGQLSTLGTEVYGASLENLYAGPTSTFTLDNGVIFNSPLNNEGHYGPPLYDPYIPSGFVGSTVEVNQDGAGYGNSAGSTGLSDSALNSVLSNSWATEGALELWIEGLTPGDKYIVQVLTAMTQGGNINGLGTYAATENVQDLVNGGSTTLSYGQTEIDDSYVGSGAYLVTETFTAGSGGNAEIYLSGSSNAVDQDAAIQIRELPEPTTYAMMLGGLALLSFCIRRQGARLS